MAYAAEPLDFKLETLLKVTWIFQACVPPTECSANLVAQA